MGLAMVSLSDCSCAKATEIMAAIDKMNEISWHVPVVYVVWRRQEYYR